MDKLNDLLQELGVSKVRLSKYLGVSRQMVYNYLELDSLEKWPKEKKILLLQLLDLKEGSNEELANFIRNKISTCYCCAFDDTSECFNNLCIEGIKAYLDMEVEE